MDIAPRDVRSLGISRDLRLTGRPKRT